MNNYVLENNLYKNMNFILYMCVWKRIKLGVGILVMLNVDRLI